MRPWVRTLATVAFCVAAAHQSPARGDSPSLVPWKVVEPGAVIDDAPLVLFWIPASPDQLRRSALMVSRDLTRFSSRCVAMRVVRFDDYARLSNLGVDMELPVAVLADGNGQPLGLIEAEGERLRVADVEDLVRRELESRNEEADERLAIAKAHLEAGEHEAAEAIYRAIWNERCLVPRQGRAAQKALRRMGRW